MYIYIDFEVLNSFDDDDNDSDDDDYSYVHLPNHHPSA